MKHSLLLILCLFFFSSFISKAQNQDSTLIEKKDSAMYIITTFNGGEFVGKLLIDNQKVVVILTEKRGRIEIPKYEIEEMRAIKSNEMSKKGAYIPDQVFATRYFISTNGLPIKKGESYMLFSLWGPDINFGLADNLSVGVMTSWFAIPIVFTAKYSIQINEKNSMALGLLAGHTLWYSSLLNAGGVLPFGAYTYGTRKSNITFSAGYAQAFADGESGGTTVLSLAGIGHISRNISFVFDSWIMPNFDNQTGALIMPGLRFQNKDKNAFQFGFAGVVSSEGSAPVPLPLVQWFRKF